MEIIVSDGAHLSTARVFTGVIAGVSTKGLGLA